MKWFINIKSIEALKKQYKKLAVKYHPDVCGDDIAMKEINAEYDQLFATLKDIHEAADGKTYTAKEETTETPDEFKDIIDSLIRMEGINIEVCGSWLWVTGSTYQYKEDLKKLRFRFSKSKSAWYFHNEGYRKSSKKTFTLDEIRDLYGSESIRKEPSLKLQVV